MTEFYRQPAPKGVLAIARKVVRYEWRMWRSLFRWILRRPRGSEGDRAFGYVSIVAPALWGFIVVSAIEIPIVDLILPWENIARIAIFLGVYGLVWMIGIAAGLIMHPHLVGEDGIRVRNGFSIDITIPWEAVETVRRRLRSLPNGRAVQFEQVGDGLALHIAMSGQTNVEVVLRSPTSFSLPKGVTAPVTEVRFHADDPSAFVTTAKEREPSRQ